MNPSIVVIGSCNTDMVVKADHLPVPGETIIGGSFFMQPGGKGANQAVAVARLGGNIYFITKIGADQFGAESLKLFEQENIHTTYVFKDPENPSGVALITVDKKGENCIVVASGANANMLHADIDQAKKIITESSLVLLQLEIPLDTVQYATEIAFKAGVKVILNPAPGRELPDTLLNMISVITPNETEAETITGVKVYDIASAKQAAEIMSKRGIKTVIITLGSEGAVMLHEGIFTHVPGISVRATDTTGAGDVFNGALAVALANDLSILEATNYACKAAAISVTRLGAQSSAPYKEELI